MDGFIRRADLKDCDEEFAFRVGGIRVDGEGGFLKAAGEVALGGGDACGLAEDSGIIGRLTEEDAALDGGVGDISALEEVVRLVLAIAKGKELKLIEALPEGDRIGGVAGGALHAGYGPYGSGLLERELVGGAGLAAASSRCWASRAASAWAASWRARQPFPMR